MSLETIEGDLLDFPNGINYIAHSCNCQNIMGGGIALQIKERYPEAYEADTKAYKAEEVSLGDFSFTRVKNRPDRYIYNLYTQFNIGRQTRQVDYEAFHRAITTLRAEIIKHETADIFFDNDVSTVGFPYKMSCSLAGGNWDIIYAMINDVFGHSTIKAYIVKNLKYL
jgi:O-acetyl-ADP-ribose deacetylase (regulator of RNase III)